MSRPGRLALAAVLLLLAAAPGHAQDAEAGRLVYDRWCAECHGETGEGDGPAADHMLPRPRNFAQARYQIRTTRSGSLPTDEDLLKILEDGMPGTAMPAWPNLSEEQKRDVIAYLKSFSPFFERLEPEPADLGEDPGPGQNVGESGRAAYEALECFKCHGEAGRGDGQSAPTLEDWRELPIRAADLSEYWFFNGGYTVEAIHTRLLTGLDGTPMPSYADAVEAGVVSEQQLWDLARYVRGLGPEEPPGRAEVVVASRTAEALPEGPDADAWEEAEAFYIPLVGQVIETPRQFSPTVDGAWVQALHDGRELAVRVTWHDPSRSPDPAWSEWQARIAPALFADGAEVPTTPLPDRLFVQFPPAIPEGMERPYFLMGNEDDPVYLWRWTSEAGVSEARANGLAQVAALPPAAGAGPGLSGQASWEAGRWRVMLRRPLVPGGEAGSGAAADDTAEDTTGDDGGDTDAGGDTDDGRIEFRAGVAIPLALYAWDGSSGETGTRGSVSGWYYLYLDEPESTMAFIVPILAVVVTAALGILLVWRAQAGARAEAEEAPAHTGRVPA